MFTGIVEAVGTVVEVKPNAGGYRLRIQSQLAPDLKPGDSLAVNGVCLTITLIDGHELHADIGPETARVTTFPLVRRGQEVNLERSLRLDTRLDGHLVQGHVDGLGTVDDVRPDGDHHWITISYPAALAPLFIRKGSVAVDGVSLTVAGIGEKQFDIQVIPYTWRVTTLKSLRPGDKVNLECDLIGKYVTRSIELGVRR